MPNQQDRIEGSLVTDEPPTTLDLVLSELRRGIEVSFVTVNGRLALLLQLNEMNERRIEEQTRMIEELDARLTVAEREQVTQSHLDARFRHTVAILMLIAASTSAVAAVGFLLINRG